MYIINHRLPEQKSDQLFKFFIKDNSVTRVTITILAEDIEIAWGRVHALFPEANLTDTEVEQAGRH